MTALVVIPMSWQYWLLVESLIVGGGILFVLLSHLGQKLMEHYDLKDQDAAITDEESRTLHIYENKIDITDATD